MTDNAKATTATAVLTATALVAGSLLGPASAGTFEVKSADSTKGEIEFAVNNAAFSGFPANADRLRFSSELLVGYGITDWFKVAAKLNIDRPADDDWQLSTAGIETLAVIRKFQGGLGLGWFTGADFRVHRDETNSVTFGPIVQVGSEQTQLSLNPFFAKTFGANREDGIELILGWGVKQQIREGFAIGIEGYSFIPNVGHAPGIDFQEHRIGPVVYLERGLGAAKPAAGGRSIKDASGPAAGEAGGPKLAVEAGVLFGLTEATQDVAFKLKAGITF